MRDSVADEPIDRRYVLEVDRAIRAGEDIYPAARCSGFQSSRGQDTREILIPFDPYQVGAVPAAIQHVSLPIGEFFSKVEIYAGKSRRGRVLDQWGLVGIIGRQVVVFAKAVLTPAVVASG